MINENLLITVFFLLITGCSYSSSNKSDLKLTEDLNNLNVDSIQILLKKQLSAGAYAENETTDVPTGYVFTQDDISVISPLIRDILKQRGYIISKENFTKRLGEIFNFKIESTIHLNPISEKCNEDIDYDIFQFKEQQIYIIPEYQIVTLPYLLPELINYQQLYPQIAKIEEQVETKVESSYGLVNLTRWKDVTDLDSRRRSNIELLYHLNSYLVNDNKASLTWLINNHPDYLKTLVTQFGYDKEEKINQMILSDIYRISERERDNINYDYSNCKNIFFSRDCKNDLRVNHGIFATIKGLTSSDNSLYLEMLYNYLKGIEAGTLMIDLSDDEKIEIYCYFGRIEVDLNKKYQKNFKWNKPYAGISSLLTGHNYQEIARKHKYWGIPNFEEIEQVVKWEEPIVNDGDMSIPSFDYSTLVNN